MKKLLSIVAILVLMMATGFMPSVARAAVGHGTVHAAHHARGCDHHGDHSSHTEQAHHHTSCCDEGVCQCIGGQCHGVSKIFNRGSDAVTYRPATALAFARDDIFADYVPPHRLKRPPKPLSV